MALLKSATALFICLLVPLNAVVFWPFASRPLHLPIFAFWSSTVHLSFNFFFLSYCIAWNYLSFRLLHLGPQSMHPSSIFLFLILLNCRKTQIFILFAFWSSCGLLCFASFSLKPLTLFYLHLGPSVLWNACVSFLQKSPMFYFYCIEVPPFWIAVSVWFSWLCISAHWFLLFADWSSLFYRRFWISFWLCNLVLNFILMAFGSSVHELWLVFAYFWACCLIQRFLVFASRSFWASICPSSFLFFLQLGP